mgnify:FL=1
MNSEVDKTNRIFELLKEAKEIAILPSQVSSIDAFSAAVGMYHALKEEGKNVCIIYPGSIPEEFGSVEGIDIKPGSSQRELVVSVDYSNTNASKVSYSTEDDILRFSISAIDKDFDLSRVRAEIKGLNFDLIITIGAQSREDLGKSLEEIGGVFGGADVLNIDNSERNQRFGSINVVEPEFESISLLVMNMLIRWGLTVSSKTAEALLKGISKRKGI